MGDDAKPLMADYKDTTPTETESLPVYRIDESSEQLVVGKETQQKSCAVGRFFRCCRATNGEEPARKCFTFKSKRRAFIWIFSFIALFVMGFSFAAHHCPSTITRAIECAPITGLTTDLTLPLASDYTRVFLHDSITTGDSHVIRTDDVEEGTLKISFTLADGTIIKGDEGDKPSLFVCHAAKDKFVGAGIHNREKGAKTPEVVSTTVTLPKKALTPPIIIAGHNTHRHRFLHKFLHKKVMKAVRKAEKKAIQRIRKAKLESSIVPKGDEDWEIVDA